MPLTDTAARNAKPREKSYKIADAKGMYLEVTPAGGKYWRMKYRFSGKEKRLALGVYLDVSLAQARERCGQARKHPANGVDPGVMKQASKAATENSFEAVATVRQVLPISETSRPLISIRIPARPGPVNRWQRPCPSPSS